MVVFRRVAVVQGRPGPAAMSSRGSRGGGPEEGGEKKKPAYRAPRIGESYQCPVPAFESRLNVSPSTASLVPRLGRCLALHPLDAFFSVLCMARLLPACSPRTSAGTGGTPRPQVSALSAFTRLGRGGRESWGRPGVRRSTRKCRGRRTLEGSEPGGGDHGWAGFAHGWCWHCLCGFSWRCSASALAEELANDLRSSQYGLKDGLIWSPSAVPKASEGETAAAAPRKQWRPHGGRLLGAWMVSV